MSPTQEILTPLKERQCASQCKSSIILTAPSTFDHPILDCLELGT